MNTDWKCVLSGETLPAESEIKFPLCFKGVGAGGGGIRFGVLIKLAPKSACWPLEGCRYLMD